MEATENFKLTISAEQEGLRLDKVFTDALGGEYSRSKVQAWIDTGLVEPKKSSSFKVAEGEVFTLNIPDEKPILPQPENIKLDIVYEDEYLLVVNKAANMVVHPGAGNDSGTLVNALLYHCKGKLSNLSGDDRPGIVHRLDKETSGLMVVAKTNEAHANLTEQLAVRDVSRIYQAVVWGLLPEQGIVDADIGRSETNRQKMAVRDEGGKEAVTEYKRLEPYGMVASLAECHLQTGRTHQIRVHMAHIGHWLVGDPIYGKG